MSWRALPDVSAADLVDAAAVINYRKIREDADFDKLKELTIQSYFKIYKDRRS